MRHRACLRLCRQGDAGIARPGRLFSYFAGKLAASEARHWLIDRLLK